MAVRFVTKRYIGEYDCTIERIYKVDSFLDASWEITDPPGFLSPPSELKLRWADAIVLVYSVSDRVSFDETSRLRWENESYCCIERTIDRYTAMFSLCVCVYVCICIYSRFLVSHARKTRKVPPIVMLIANKADLTYTPGERVVSTAEGRQRAEEIEAHAFHEISVRESVEQVTLTFLYLFTAVIIVCTPDILYLGLCALQSVG